MEQARANRDAAAGDAARSDHQGRQRQEAAGAVGGAEGEEPDRSRRATTPPTCKQRRRRRRSTRRAAIWRRPAPSLHQAAVNLGYTTIISPINGVVISRNVDVGQTVAASLQAPTLFTIAEDLRQDAGARGGLRGRRRAAGGRDAGDVRRRRLPATRDSRASSARSATRRRRCRTWSPTTPSSTSTTATLRLKPGMTANVTFVYAAHKGRAARSPARRCASCRRPSCWREQRPGGADRRRSTRSDKRRKDHPAAAADAAGWQGARGRRRPADGPRSRRRTRLGAAQRPSWRPCR